MRLWSFHPGYLDRYGLIALWREGLLAQAVLRGQTRGYRNHPQLDRFKAHVAPLAAISIYLQGVHSEATARGYVFDVKKIGPAETSVVLPVTSGQVEYEWIHFLAKLKKRDPDLYERWRVVGLPEPHPMFDVRPGEIEPWERC